MVSSTPAKGEKELEAQVTQLNEQVDLLTPLTRFESINKQFASVMTYNREQLNSSCLILHLTSVHTAQHNKASVGRRGEGAGFLLREAARGRALVSGAGSGKRTLRGETHGGVVLHR